MPASALPSTGAAAGSPVLCDTRDMLMIHSAFRAHFADAIRLVRAAPDADSARASVLGGYLLELSDALHHHHHGEDDLLWDRLEQRAPTCAVHVEKMKADHAEVARLLKVVEADIPNWIASGAAADRDRVADAVQQVSTVLDAHLGSEESVILPIAATTITKKEWDEIGARARAAIPRDRMMVQLGTILETTAPEYRDLLWNELPPPVRLLYRMFGKKQYEKRKAEIEGTAA